MQNITYRGKEVKDELLAIIQVHDIIEFFIWVDIIIFNILISE